ncbi:UNVERIFIED_CONTAM: LINE-1 reverse transcriptase [Sesamum latifolium]|uniref:LINE-1 reverse transcriptase n=1 Tax=Sesamum latifolium TaxID=2727402 RepID=A0AAW2UVD6_9LAMI
MISAAIWNVRGLNRRDHQVSVNNLVAEHRLQFIGLLETRVSAVNVARVQRGMLPRWNGDQCVHCNVYIRGTHIHVLMTIVYGVNDVVGRRMLWADLDRLSHTSGDIRGAAEEFQECLRGTGLITLPMQGEWFTWHNCSRDSRSLWKRLDWLLVNDCWLGCWPNTYYVSLNARTSDHSPLVFRGDIPIQSVSMFRFDNYLALSSDFIPSVQRIWQHRIVGTTMFAVTRKLKALKPVFRALRQKKGDLSNNVKLAASFLDAAQNLHVISEDEALLLVQPVTPGEIKQALFDIDEIKAPGPDGYSSGFLKAAWPIVGEEVTRATMEFFETGRLLKQVNSTLISLIPKVNTPTVLAEFRPISCCNVLYKVITKHLPPRCALKVDLRKAYDTIEWNFLSAVLALFGFPEQFILWIEECVTMSSFSVCLNGSPDGFFRGARELRQGDPMSPYLFVLVMEVLTLILQQLVDQDGGFSYHWLCGELHLFQLGFADDLLLFNRADTDSVLIFKRALTAFADLSRLQVNLQKSHLILSRSPLLKGYTSIYLGLSGRSSSPALFGPTSPGFTTVYSVHIRGWDCYESNSSLTALQVYWAMAFILPKTVIREIDLSLEGLHQGYAKVSWQQVCRPVTEVIVLDHGNGEKLVHLWVCLRPFIAYKIGSGTYFSLWHELGPLILRFPFGPRHSATSATALLSTVIMEGSWNWPPITNMESIEITHSLPIIHGGMNPILWMGPGDSFSSTAAYDMLHPPGPKVDWSSLLVGTFKIPRHRFIL